MHSPARSQLPWILLGAFLLAADPAARPMGGVAADGPSVRAGPGLLEKTGVELFLLDVEAVDKAGRPLRGLKVEDFTVRRDGRPWPVVSVDDFCSCDGATGGAAGATEQQVASPPKDASPATTAADRPLYVLYFDFAQLRSDGRHDAFETARRWLREVKEDDDEAMVAAYVTSKGILTLCDPTHDRDRLVRALDAAEPDRFLVDLFAAEMPQRTEDCEVDPTTCIHSARLEYAHGRRSLEAFQTFLGRMGNRAGRKIVLYFHENGMMEPGVLYLQAGQQNHYSLAEGVGAAATSARAAVYPLLTGMGALRSRMEPQTSGLGATLAEATGGAYNRSASDFARLAMSAGRGCRCRYVLGLEPVKKGTRSVLAVSVVARGVRLPYLYRVRPVVGEDLWLQKASAVLDDPLSAQDIAVGAALLPSHAGERSWSVAVQVVVDTRSFLMIPRGPRKEGNWEVGARLKQMDGHGVWEMLGSSVGTVSASSTPDAAVLYARTFTGLHPGPYRLTAFVRDRMANLFGGAEAVLDLPAVGKGGVAGPVMRAERSVRLVSTLPLIKDATASGTDTDARSIRDSGPVPVDSHAVLQGTALQFESWICPSPGVPGPVPVSFLSRDDAPLYRIVPRHIPSEGACVRRMDDVPTASLEPGPYTYVLLPALHPGDDASLPIPFVVLARSER